MSGELDITARQTQEDALIDARQRADFEQEYSIRAYEARRLELAISETAY